MNTHSPSVIGAHGAVDRISRTGDSTGPESAYSISLFSDRKSDFSPTLMVEESAAVECQSAPAGGVGEVRHSHTAADLRRELQIQQRGRDIERYQAEVAAVNAREPHVFTDFADAAIPRGKADLCRREMERLIRERSPEQLARMRAAQDERMAGEPGATR